ncbi:AAA family ATPase [Blastococcus sp. PRF04-17]|uniref:AAA family ATPase n=1 Tax=Blastococcus sp. PRF04-17 TaxID=2933797 RepID=UPI001FF61D8E|nr:ATP-binding protein [Blastococcus sp. PRF04-17]UOY02727.1 ATP-binding protein [Blastococcus sp. PRF04-17]
MRHDEPSGDSALIHGLQLTNFKSFERSSFQLAPFTLLVGANASGKSNVREALRFLHGVSRGYTLAEIVGEKWVEGGVRVWTGVRGGAAQVARFDSSTFSLCVEFSAAPEGGKTVRFNYLIEVERLEDNTLRVIREHLKESNRYIFDTHPDGDPRGHAPPMLKARIRKGGGGYPPDDSFLDDRPILVQMLTSSVATEITKRPLRLALSFLSSMVFLDLNPHAARDASPVGIAILGDRGENLSSVLYNICKDERRKAQLTSWVRALTPMDAVDVSFREDLNGRVLALLVEDRGDITPLTSASDGTVRFLAMIAALMNPARPQFLFFEEIENGIHPNRVYLLLDLISQSVTANRSQIVATSHSPQMLVHAYRSDDASPSLVFRDEAGRSHVVDVQAAEELRRILDVEDPASLMAAGWFEDTAAFLSDHFEFTH